uniref:Ras association domain-containing protein 2 n=1 Tax=Magallana gigas TaxID=29159 RepID=K1RAM6_MAGGI
MSSCPKCGKTVYFAERKTSLGKNWHPNCLKCEECGKILSPGQHAEEFGKPDRQKMKRIKMETLFDYNQETLIDLAERELLKKIDEFNAFYEGKKRQSLTIKKSTDQLVIEGPVRIYWGVVQPIRLQEFDDVPSVPSPTSWRHSFIPGDRIPDIKPALRRSRSPEPVSPRVSRGVDDSVIFSPPDGVVLRKKNIKKFNTVAYRGDSRPNKWKRASINGHIYNFDTRVFTPVLGSCTSVTVDSKCTTYGVIKTLLEKFKIENQPEEYSLYLVSEKEGEILLKDSDRPLLERIARGPDETSGVKIYLKDRIITTRKNSLVTQAVREEEEEEEEEEGVEQLIAIPEPVLLGILRKFKEDEDREVRTVRARKLVKLRSTYDATNILRSTPSILLVNAIVSRVFFE